MPVFNPAVLPPVEAPLAPLREAAAAHAVLRLLDLRIHMLGPQVLTAARMQQVVSQQTRASDAVRALAELHHGAGFPAAQLRYALDGKNLYVLVVLGDVRRVDVPAPLDAYFADLPEQRVPLTDDEFEPRRALASIHADRAGLNAEPVFQPLDGGGYVLDMKPDDGGPDRTVLGTAFNNHGNRFVGRYFADTKLRHSTRAGDEFTLGWRTALTGLENDARAQAFDEYGGGWSRVTPAGVFGISAQYLKYDFLLQGGLLVAPVDTTSEQTLVELSWQYPLAADFDRRWMFGALLDYSNKRIEDSNNGAQLQEQEHGVAEIGTAMTRVWRWTRHALELGGGAQLRHGLGKDGRDRAEVRADLGYWLLRPEAGATWLIDEDWSLRTQLFAQLGQDPLPEEAQWVLGGVDNLRAWLPGVAVGDSGLLLRLQGEFLGWKPTENSSVVPALFVEAGRSKFESPELIGAPDRTARLADAGAQLTVKLGTAFEAGVASALPIQEKGVDQAVLDQAEADLFFHLALRF